LTQATSRAVFVLDALGPMTDEALEAATDALRAALLATSTDASISSRVLANS
jgi:DNA/RNA-binding domain of Phe-tRNA-synthetase-like protein